MQHARSLLLVFAMALAPSVFASESINIAAAADLKFCMDEIIVAFKRSHPDVQVEVSYGSSGNFATQIRQGAPFDLFFSADIDYPRQLANDGFAASDVRLYALGRIVLWSASMDAGRMTLADLERPEIGRIAIANPQHAPYGKRAEEALRASGMWEKVQAKLVLGENIAQTAQFVRSGNAQVGIIALSLALNPELAGKGGYYLVPDNLHKPLQQAYMISKRASDNPLAKTFADYMQAPDTRAAMVHCGFALPGETLAR
jgi:molybdate transport system substrate-binding protein